MTLGAPSVDTRRGRNMGLLWAGQFVNTAGLMMLVPIMPFYLETLGTRGLAATQTWAGMAIAAPALTLTVATPLWGRLGDRIGRKWMVVRALVGLGLAMVVMAAATSPLWLVIGRLLQGSVGGVVEAAQAFAGSTGSDKKRGAALGKSFSATAAGALVGPIAGGLFVGTGGLHTLMLLIAAAAGLLAVGCAVGLRESAPVPSPAPDRPAQSDRRRGSVRAVPGVVPLALAAIGAYFGIYGLIPVFAEHVRGLDTDSASLWVGVLHSVMWGATLIGSLWWGRRNDTTGRPLRTFAIAAGGCAASIAALSIPLPPAAYLPLRLVQGFCFAALAQSLMLHFSRHARADNRGSFVSTANSFLLVGQSAGPLLAGPIVAVLPVGVAVAVMALACAAACLLTLAPAQREHHDARNRRDSDTTTPIPIATTSGGGHGGPRAGGTIAPPPDSGVTVAPFR